MLKVVKEKKGRMKMWINMRCSIFFSIPAPILRFLVLGFNICSRERKIERDKERGRKDGDRDRERKDGGKIERRRERILLAENNVSLKEKKT